MGSLNYDCYFSGIGSVLIDLMQCKHFSSINLVLTLAFIMKRQPNTLHPLSHSSLCFLPPWVMNCQCPHSLSRNLESLLLLSVLSAGLPGQIGVIPIGQHKHITSLNITLICLGSPAQRGWRPAISGPRIIAWALTAHHPGREVQRGKRKEWYRVFAFFSFSGKVK